MELVGETYSETQTYAQVLHPTACHTLCARRVAYFRLEQSPLCEVMCPHAKSGLVFTALGVSGSITRVKMYFKLSLSLLTDQRRENVSVWSERHCHRRTSSILVQCNPQGRNHT